MKRITSIAAVLLLGTAAPAFADHHGSAAHQTKQTIAEVATASPQHTTLIAAVQAAGLAGALAGDGPLTVFAPTDQAFAKLPDGTVDTLLQPENRAQLQGVLTYHVIPGETNAEALVAAISGAGEEGYTLTTLNGATLTAMLVGENVVLRDTAGNTATVTQTDIGASNGVVHVIDGVLLP
jgi:uncharacterized surface protein with fasciclin (FAS1) repeats